MLKLKPSTLGRALAAHREKVECTCSECGKTFTAYAYALTCSPTCRTRRSRRLRAGNKS